MSAPPTEMPSSLEQLETKSKFWRKIQDAPLVPIGVTGGVVAFLTSMLAFRNKSSTTKTSVYLIHTRLAVQGIIIGTLTGGMVYHLWADHLSPYLQERKQRKW